MSVSNLYGHEPNHIDDHRRGREAGEEIASNAAGDRLSEILGDKGKSNVFDIDKWLDNKDNLQAIQDGKNTLDSEYDGYEGENSSYLDQRTREAGSIASTKSVASKKLENKKADLAKLTNEYQQKCSGRQLSGCSSILNQISSLEKEIKYLQGVATTGQGSVHDSETKSQKTPNNTQNAGNKPSNKPNNNTSSKAEANSAKKIKTKEELVSEMYSKGYTPDQYEIREEKGGVLRVVLDSYKTPDNLNYDDTNVIVWNKGLDIPLKVADAYLKADNASMILTQGHLTDTFGPVLSGGLINKFGPNSGWGSGKDKTELSGNSNYKKLTNEEIKKVGSLSEQKDIRELPGNSEDALKFFQAQVSDYKEVKPGVFVGKDENGITFTYRAQSKSGPPTIDVNGIKGIRKIKFKE